MCIGFNSIAQPMSTPKGDEKAVGTASKAKITKAEKVGYSVAPVIQGTIDLIQGDSFKEVGDKLVLTGKSHFEGLKKLAGNACQGLGSALEDSKEGPVKKIMKYTGLGRLINIFAD